MSLMKVLWYFSAFLFPGPLVRDTGKKSDLLDLFFLSRLFYTLLPIAGYFLVHVCVSSDITVGVLATLSCPAPACCFDLTPFLNSLLQCLFSFGGS